MARYMYIIMYVQVHGHASRPCQKQTNYCDMQLVTNVHLPMIWMQRGPEGS